MDNVQIKWEEQTVPPFAICQKYVGTNSQLTCAALKNHFTDVLGKFVPQLAGHSYFSALPARICWAELKKDHSSADSVTWHGVILQLQFETKSTTLTEN